MPEKRYSRRIPDQIWDGHKSTILRLYLSDNRPLTASGGVKDIMYSQHGFFATKAQYETRLKRWGFYKYASAHDRHNQAPMLNDCEGDGLNTERHMKASNNRVRNIAIRTSSPYCFAVQSAPLGSRAPGIVPSASSSLGHNISSVLTTSVTFPPPLFGCDAGSFLAENHSFSQHATSGLYGVCDSAGSILDGFVPCATDLTGKPFVPDFATSIIPVISHLFPRAVSSAHMILFGDSAAIESEIASRFHPSALSLVSAQSIDHQIIYMIVHHLINHVDVVRTLDKPKTKLDQFFKTGITYYFSLGPDVLSSIIRSTPSPYDLALIHSIFQVALFLGHGPVLNILLKINKGSLVNRSVLLGDTHYYPLEYTSYFGHIQATEVLLDHGANPNLQRKFYFLNAIGSMPWSPQRSTKVRVHIIRLLIHNGLDIKTGSAVLEMERCDIDELKLLVTYCLKRSFETFFSHQALPIFLLRQIWDDSSSNVIDTIIERASPDAFGEQKLWDSVLSESLSCAVLRNHTSAVSILLARGAKPNVNCLITAAQSNNLRVLEAFLDRGLDPNAHWSKPPFETRTDYHRYYDRSHEQYLNCTALGQSIKNRSRGAYEVLRARGFVSKLAHQPDGLAAAFVAACQVGDSTLIEELSSFEGAPRAISGMENALEAALEEDQHHIIEKLLFMGIKPTIRCLEIAIQNKCLAAVKILVNFVDLPRQLESFGASNFMDTSYDNSLLFAALQWNDRATIEHVLSMDYPVDALFSLHNDKFSDWNLAPELHAPGFMTTWYLTPLSAAILRDNKTVTETLMACGTHAVFFDSHFTSYEAPQLSESSWCKMILTPLAAGAIKNDVSLIKELLRIGANPFDNSALFMCAVLDLPEIATLLVSAFKHQYPDGVRFFGCDALYEIIRRKNLQLLGLLANEVDITGRVQKYCGARPFCVPRPQSDTEFTSPLGEAIRLHAESSSSDKALDLLVPLIKDHSAIVYRDLNRGSMTCVLYAIFLNSLPTVQKLHQAGANLSLPTKPSMPRTALQAAAQAGNRDIVEYLLGQGANPNEPPAVRAGATALQLAAISGNINIASILLEAGADINAPPACCDGRTAFEGATEHGRIEMMIFLVGEGADLLANNNEQYRRAIAFAEDNLQYAAKAVADELYTKALASQGPSFIDMGGEQWAGYEAPNFGSLF